MRRSFQLLFVGLVLAATVGLPANAICAAKEIAVIWDSKSLMVNNVLLGLLPRLRELAPDVKVSVHREMPNMEEAKKVFHDSETKKDGIVFFRSSGAQFLGTTTPKVPCFIGACNNPAEIGVIKNLNAPEGMVTGVTYFIPYDKRFEVIRALFPNAKSVALIWQAGHPGGPIDQAGTKEQCKRFGIEYKEAVAPRLDQLLEEIKKVGKVDLYIISSTALAMDNVVNFLPICNATKTPMFSYADKPVKSGAVAGIAADDMKLGQMLAESVVDVVVKGKPIRQVPVKMDPDPKLSLNKAMMQKLDLKVPEDILKRAVVLE